MTSLNLRRLAAAAATFSLVHGLGRDQQRCHRLLHPFPQCLEYKVVGICYWLLCGPHGCKVKTSVKVRHYVPDAVVSSYANTGSNPWTEVSALGTPNPLAQAGNDATTNYKAENSIGRFKEADVIGHPGGATFSRFASASGYVCPGATVPLVPYFSAHWTPLAGGMEFPSRCTPKRWSQGCARWVESSPATWGTSIRAAVSCTRPTTTRRQPSSPSAPAISPRESASSTSTSPCAQPQGRLLAGGRAERGRCLDREMAGADPIPEPQLRGVSQPGPKTQAVDGDYAWALWRPYPAASARQIFLGSTDFQ